MDSESTPQAPQQEEQVPNDITSSGINVVGIGASAGGIRALQTFFAHTPLDSGMAFVVILHLPPNMESNAAAILQQTTSMPVAQVTEVTPVEPNRVYVIPPTKHLSMQDGTIHLQDPDGERVRRAPIDLFFRTLADTHGRNAAAVVLSGSGADGTVGVQRIKENGGAVLAQDPQEAEFDAMPRNVIATGLVDFVLPVADMPAALIEYWRTAETVQLPVETALPAADGDVLREIFALLRARTGHDFSQYKRPTLLRRIGRRMQVNNVVYLPAYLAVLRARPNEVQALLRDLLISVTNFFRDPDAWVSLAAIIPNLFANKDASDQVRVWVAGCATGEEAYSVAMLLYEHALTLDGMPVVQVFATDIDEEAINTARHGLYPETIVADVSPERLQRFFTLEQGRYRVRKEIRDMVLFAPHNLVRDPPFSKLDLITCRNLLIYLNREVQEQVLRLFHFVLLPDGFLLLGASESTDSVAGLFTPIDKGSRLFQRRTSPFTSVVTVPQLPLVNGGRVAPPGRHHNVEGPAQAFAELDLQVLARYGPPRVIVNEEYDIVHLAQGAGRFLTLADGELSPNLLRMVHPDLRLELRTALFTAMQRGENTETGWQRVEIAGVPRLVHARVQPIRQPEWASGYLLVLFNDMADTGEVIRNPAADAEPMVRQLEDELRRTKEQLRATIEQYETAVEEYKAANEELQAINEELRATTEELETSKEELQSVNEELITVNAELKHKVDEVSHANNDLQNLMASTDIATIFVDRELRIRRYTPSAQSVFNLIATDIGRPLAHITHNLDYQRMVDDAASVLQTLVRTEREVPSQNGRWYMVRLLPYRTVEDRIDGVVLNFIDITERKQAEEVVRESQERLRLALSAADMGTFLYHVAEDRGEPDARMLALFGLPEDGTLNLAEALTHLIHPDDRDRYAQDVARATDPAGDGMLQSDIRVLQPDGSVRWVAVTAQVLFADKPPHATLMYGVAADISERKRAEQALELNHFRLTKAMQATKAGWGNWNLLTGEAEWSEEGKQIIGFESDEEASTAEGWLKRIHPEDRPNVEAHAAEVFANHRDFHLEYRIIRSDGETRWLLGTGKAFYDENGTAYQSIGLVIDITERKQAEDALRKSEARLQGLVENLPGAAVFIVDHDLRYMLAAGEALRDAGMQPEDLLGKTIFEALDVDLAAGYEKTYEQALNGEPFSYEHDAHGRTYLTRGSPLRAANGEVYAVLAVSYDISERKSVEATVQHARSELETRVQERTAELAQANARLQDLIRTLVTAQEDERRRIARELHDQLGQQISALQLKLAALENTARTDTSLQAHIGQVQQIATMLDRDVDRLAYDLRPSGLDDFGLHVALQQHVHIWSERYGVRAELQILENSERTVPLEIQTVLYRVVQEALTNVVKHAEAQHVSVILEHRSHEVRVIIEDDGKGFNPDVPYPEDGSHRLGLSGMHERVELVRGTIAIESEPGRGTTVYVRIPLPDSEEGSHGTETQDLSR